MNPLSLFYRLAEVIRSPKKQTFTLSKGSITWLIYFGLICLLSFVCFGHLARHSVIDGDDLHHLAQGKKISSDFSELLSLKNPAPRPTIDLIFSFGYELWKGEVKWYRFLVVFSHTIASFLLALVCWKMGQRKESSFLAGIFFLTTVAQFRNVGQIAGLSYAVALAMGLLGVFIFVQMERAGNFKGVVCFSLLVLFGALSHPSIITVLPFCLFVSFNRGIVTRHTFLKLIPAGLFSAGAIFCLVFFYPNSLQTYHSIHEPNIQRIIKHFLWLLSRLVTTAHWLPLPIYKFQKWELAIGLFVLIGLVLLLLRKRSHAAEWAFAVLITLLPFVNRLPRSFLADTSGPSRYLYLASTGTSVLLALFLTETRTWLCRKNQILSKVIYLGLISCILINSILTFDKLQAFWFLSAGKSHWKIREVEKGAELLNLAIEYDQSENVIPREEAYVALSHAMYLKGDSVETVIKKGLQEFPDSYRLNAVWGAFESMESDSIRSREGFILLTAAERSAAKQGMEDELKILISQTYQYTGESLDEKGAYDQAISANQRALAYDPNNVDAYANLALGYMAVEQIQNAIVSYQKYLQHKPSNEIYYNLGFLYEKMGQFQEAAEAFEQAIELNPQDHQSHTRLAIMLRSMGRLEEAELSYRRAIKLAADDPELHHGLGTLLILLDDRSEAMKTLETAARMGSDNANTYRYLRKFFAETHQPEKAEEFYRQLLAAPPQDGSSHFFTQIGIELLALGNIDDSIYAYRQALERDVQNITARVNLGWCLYSRGELDAAIEEYRLVLLEQPNSAAQFNLGLAYLAKGDIDAARQTYARAVREFSAEEAWSLGAVNDLKELISQDIQVASAREILQTYWQP